MCAPPLTLLLALLVLKRSLEDRHARQIIRRRCGCGLLLGCSRMAVAIGRWTGRHFRIRYRLIGCQRQGLGPTKGKLTVGTIGFPILPGSETAYCSNRVRDGSHLSHHQPTSPSTRSSLLTGSSAPARQSPRSPFPVRPFPSSDPARAHRGRADHAGPRTYDASATPSSSLRGVETYQ